MDSKTLRADLLLLLTAAIWGTTFVAQKKGMDFVGPFTYNGIRFLIGCLSLLPLLLLRTKQSGKQGGKHDGKHGAENPAYKKQLVIYSLIAGTLLLFGVGLQQLGMIYTSIGNSGFITGMYVVFVPIAGVFLKRKTGLPTWIGAFAAFTGLFLVSVFSDVEGLTRNIFFTSLSHISQNLNKGDMLIFICSGFWTCHVLFIDKAVKKVDAIQLSAGQFFVCGTLMLLAAGIDIAKLTGISGEAASMGIVIGPELFSNAFSAQNIIDGTFTILYGGIFSAGIAYTLQAVAQQYAPPAHASIIMCLEAVFAAAGGILIAGEPVNTAKAAGFALMFAGMIATQWDMLYKRKRIY